MAKYSGIKAIVLTGQKEFDAKIKTFETKAGNRIARATLGAGMRTLRKSIRSFAPEWMKEFIGMRGDKSNSSGTYQAKVGVNVGKRKKAKKVTWNGWVPVAVLGTQQRSRKSLGGKFASIANPTAQQLSTGSIAPHPIVKQGVAAATGAMQTQMKLAFERAVAREVAKAKLNKG